MSAAKQKNGRDAAALLRESLGVNVLGEALRLDAYAHNPFRFLSVSAAAPGGEIETARQRLRGVLKLSPARAMGQALDAGYPPAITADDLPALLRRLDDPRERMRDELFWPHLDGEHFAVLCATRSLTGREAIDQLFAIANEAGGEDQARLIHALAVLVHNFALAQELALWSTGAEPGAGDWEWALALWGTAFQFAPFWERMETRARVLADPRVRPEAVDALRSELPGALLAVHGFFAERWATAGQIARALHHLTLLRSAALPGANGQTERILAGVTRALAVQQLTPLIAEVEQKLLKPERKLARAAWRKEAEPMLVKAEAIVQRLAAELGLDPQDAEFDGFCEKMQQAVNLKLDYDQDNTRTIFDAMLVTRRLQRFPLSIGARKKLDEQIRADAKILYGKMGGLNGLDPTQCWFLPGERAEADASLVIEMHDDVRHEGNTIRWTRVRVLIPRSAKAREHHENPRAARRRARAASGSEGGGMEAFVRFCKSLVGIQPTPPPPPLPVPVAPPAPEPLARPLTAQGEFPPLKQARRQGIRDGAEPV